MRAGAAPDLLAGRLEGDGHRVGPVEGHGVEGIGDRDGAMQRWQEVRGIIQKARDQGLSREELGLAFSRARQTLEQIEATKG